MSKRIEVKVVRETKKALMVEADGRQGWIQRRWMDEDGTVSVATFDKATANQQARQAEQDAAREWRQALHPVRVDRETEKAIGTEVVYVSGDGEQTIRRMLWLPKSQSANDEGARLFPGWLIAAKVDEMTSRVRSECPQACAFLDYSDRDRLFA